MSTNEIKRKYLTINAKTRLTKSIKNRNKGSKTTNTAASSGLLLL